MGFRRPPSGSGSRGRIGRSGLCPDRGSGSVPGGNRKGVRAGSGDERGPCRCIFAGETFRPGWALRRE